MPPKTVGPRRGEWFLGEPAGGGLTILQCQRTAAYFFLRARRNLRASAPEHGEHPEQVLFDVPPMFRRVIKQLKRGAGNRSARVLILTKHRCQGRENFSGLCPRNFSALFLDKTSVGEEQFSKEAAPVRACALTGAAIGREGGASVPLPPVRSAPEHDDSLSKTV